MCVSAPFDYQVLNLSPTFYRDYPETKYVELMRKQDRPYKNLKRVNVPKCINRVWITVKL